MAVAVDVATGNGVEVTVWVAGGDVEVGVGGEDLVRIAVGPVSVAGKAARVEVEPGWRVSGLAGDGIGVSICSGLEVVISALPGGVAGGILTEGI